MEIWEPTTFEYKLLYKYWNKNKGNLFLEVPVGNKELGKWPPGSKIRRIDGVLLLNDLDTNKDIAYPYKDYTIANFNEQTKGNTIELIEVKRKLNRVVIGQVLAGIDMFERQYEARKIIPVILCHVGDPALEWVCKKRNIEVYIINNISTT